MMARALPLKQLFLEVSTRKIPQWQATGYRISLFFLKLESVEIAIDRVAERVRQCGHNIPEPVIRRRYIAGWKKFPGGLRQPG
jgi:predicted ABC-type ATPase